MFSPDQDQTSEVAAQDYQSLAVGGAPTHFLESQFDLGVLAAPVRIVSPHSQVFEYLRQFYCPASSATPSRDGWTIKVASVSDIADAGNVTPFGVRFFVDPHRRVISVWGAAPESLAITTRKLLRELFLDACEHRGFSLFHASAVCSASSFIMFVGAKESGKTTLALDAHFNHGYDFVSNDHGVLYQDGASLSAVRFPTYINVKHGTLRSMWHRFAERLDLAKYDLPPTPDQLTGHSRTPVYFAPEDLGCAPLVPFEGLGSQRSITLVFPKFSPEKLGVVREISNDEALTRLTQQLRSSWVYDAAFNPRLLELGRRDLNIFQDDGFKCACRLVEQGRSFTYRHSGTVDDFLSFVARSDREEQST